MSFTTPLYIPLIKGLDLSRESTLGGPELYRATNIDFSVAGEVRGRPSRSAPSQVLARDPAAAVTARSYLATTTFANSGFTPLGLMRVRDAGLERPAIGCAGRLFVHEDSLWRDRGHFACARVDRVKDLYQHPTGTITRTMSAPDFAQTYTPQSGVVQMSLVDTTSFGFERFTTLGITPSGVGGSARCGTVTASLAFVTGPPGTLYLVTRSANGTTLTETSIATDCATPTNNGDAPGICCDHDATNFWVVYRSTAATTIKVLRVTTAGSVTATYTLNLGVTYNGFWVANSPVAGDKVVLGLTHSTGGAFNILNATAMTSAGFDSSYTTSAGASAEVVVGCQDSTTYWWAFRTVTNEALYIGTALLGTAGSATLRLAYRGGVSAGSRWHTPMHQPVLVGGRMYLTIANALYPNSTEAAVGTWFTLDLTSVSTGAASGGPFPKPTLVARGPLDGAAFGMGTSASTKFQPESAVTLAAGGWVFTGVEWSEFQQEDAATGEFGTFAALKGLKPIKVLYRIEMSGPRVAVAGGATLFSGSVPRALTGDQCYETGFPAGRPHISAQLDGAAGSTLVGGSYTLYALWAYTDGSGQVHRSNANGITQSASAGDDIWVHVENPYFTERPEGEVVLEVYATENDPTDDSLAYLVSTTTPNFAGGRTTVIIDTEPVTTTRPLYLLQDEFAHFTPNADGGIASLGRRVWTASADTVYASLLLDPYSGVTWNDEGSLSITLPAGAGRIQALEALDDKLIIFCERGVYATQDGGPDNVGAGPDLSFPIKISDLGCAGPRSTCATDRGAAFVAPLDSTDPQRGGPWLLDRSLSLTERKHLGTPALSFFTGNGSWVPELAFSPERQQLYVTVPDADGSGTDGCVVVDFRNEKWSTWAMQSGHGALRHIDTVEGVLWTLTNEAAPLNGTPGADDTGNYSMSIATGHYSATGPESGMGWARVRSVTALGTKNAGVHDLTIASEQDQGIAASTTFTSLAAAAAATTWPTTRQAPEHRLPMQKCSSIQVTLTATPANARWTAIRLDIQPLPRKAPAKNRA